MNIQDLKNYIGESINYQGHDLRVTEVSRQGVTLMQKETGAVATITIEKFNSMVFAGKINA